MDIDNEHTTYSVNKDIENPTKVNNPRIEISNKNNASSKVFSIFLICFFGILGISYSNTGNTEGNSFGIDSGNTISLNSLKDNGAEEVKGNSVFWKWGLLFLILIMMLGLFGVIWKLWSSRKSRNAKLNKII